MTTTRTLSHKNMLRVLAANDGACLIWQVPGGTTEWEHAVANGVVLLDADHDLYVHPAAIRTSDGAYTMPRNK